MSILIKDMEMPQYCGACHVGFCRQIGCDKYIGFDNYATSRHPDCPLVEVPQQHGRLGDLDRLEQMFADIDNAPYSGFDGTEPFYSAEDAAQIIRLAPTIIPESEEGE